MAAEQDGIEWRTMLAFIFLLLVFGNRISENKFHSFRLFYSFCRFDYDFRLGLGLAIGRSNARKGLELVFIDEYF